MGIKELGKFIRDEGIDCEFELELTYFSGTAWGIDTLNWIYRQIPLITRDIIDRKDNMFEPILEEEIYNGVKKRAYTFTKKLTDHNITPVWIWDGISQGNKTVTQEERREKRKQSKLKKEALFEQLSSKDILELTNKEIMQWKNSVCNTTGMNRKSTAKLKKFTEELGLPTITSEDEAENLASSLSVEGKISLVWSNDTDNYPLGASRVASEFKYRKGIVYVKGIEPKKIVSHLNWDFKKFRDFCILMGTDFNKRFKGMGPKTNYKLIQTYGSIEKVAKISEHNFSFLDYKNIRKQLTPYSTYFQLRSHLRPKCCECPDQIEELQNKHPELDIQTIISNINDLTYNDCIFSPMLKNSIVKVELMSDDEDSDQDQDIKGVGE